MRKPKFGNNGESPPYILPELLRSIMARLPVKSLCRFKCMSASLNSIISDPQFEALQFDSSAMVTNLRICVYRNGLMLFSASFGHHIDDASVEHQQPVAFVQLPQPCPKLRIYEPFSQSLGGLICICFDNFTMRIYNPSTGETSGDILIPEHVDSCKVFGSGFGYDPIGRTHKILGMWLGTGMETEARYRVLTLDKQMEWRSLRGGDSEMPIIMRSSSSMCFNGVVYYIGFQMVDSKRCFAGFDVRLEVLRWVGLPPGAARLSFVPTFTEFNGHLALYGLKHLNNDSNDEIILWIFKGFDEQWDPWSCIRIAKPPQWKQVINSQVVIIEGTVPSGELLFRYADRRSVLPITLFYYNMDNKIIRAVSVLPQPAETELFLRSSESGSESSTPPYANNFVLLTSHVESIKSLKFITS